MKNNCFLIALSALGVLILCAAPGCSDSTKNNNGDEEVLIEENASESEADEESALSEISSDADELVEEEAFDPRAVKNGDPCNQTGVTICSETRQCACFGFTCQPNGVWRYDTLMIDGSCKYVECDYSIYEPLADGDVEYEYICG